MDTEYKYNGIVIVEEGNHAHYNTEKNKANIDPPSSKIIVKINREPINKGK